MSNARWKTFWITFAIFGALNVGLFAYFLSLPIEPVGKRGIICRDTPDWFDRTAFGLNFPGAILAGPIASAIVSQGDQKFAAGSQAIGLGLIQVLSTIIWAGIAALVVSPVKPPVSIQDGPSLSG